MKVKKNAKRIISFLLAIMLMLDIPFMTNYIRAEAEEISKPIELNAKAQYIADTYANVEKVVYGKSVMGRDLEAYIINGVGYNDRTIFCNFTVHGFEDFYFRDGQVLTKAANDLIEYIAQNPHLLRNCRIVIIPCANPDGAIEGVNNYRTGSDAFGRNTADHVDINRDFIDFKGQETRALRDLMIKSNPYIYLDLHGWLNSVLGDGFLVDAFRSTNNLRRDQTGAFGASKGYAIGYARTQLNAYSALVEFESPETVDYVKIANGIAKSIDYLPPVTNKWGVNRYGWCYTDGYGNMVTSRWVKDYYDWCYVDSNGTMITNAWQMDYKGWCYVDGDGHLVRNSWIQHPKGMCYVDEEGHSVTSRWVYIDGAWYYFNSEGYMVKNNWQVDYKGWCYLGADGKMFTNAWVQHPKGMCYVDADGHSVAGSWVNIDGSMYYFNSDGYMVKNNWQVDYKGWCYLGADGKMFTNAWVQHPKGMCYVDADGHSVAGSWVNIDGSMYYFNGDGYMMTNRWIMDEINWCYVGSDGKRITNAWAKDYWGWCVVDNDGHLITNSWAEKDSQRYYMDANGHMTVGWLDLDGNRYYFFEDGSMALGKQTIDGVEYDFGTDGIAKTPEVIDPIEPTEQAVPTQPIEKIA